MLTKQTKTMKKIILLFAAVLSFTAVNAPEKSQKVDATAKATTMTEKISAVLTLTTEQKERVQAANLETVKLIELNQTTNANKPNELEVEKQRIHKLWDTDMTAIVGEQGLQKWKKFQADEKAKK